MAIYCQNCGTKNSNNDQYCKACGTRLPKKEEPTKVDNNVEEVQENNGKKKSSKLKWVILTLLLIIILIGGALAYFLVFRTKDKEVPKTAETEKNSSAETLSMPQFDPKPGTYNEAQKVKINSTDQNSKIYYTTDGSTPTDQSTEYKSGDEITVDKDTTLKAIVINGDKKSNVATGDYKIGNSANTSTPSTDPNANTSNTSNVENLSTQMIANWPFYNQNMLRNFVASSTSTKDQQGSTTYQATNVLDNDSKTAWVENVDGNGMNETINLTYNGSNDYTISNIYFLDGYCLDQESYDKYSTPTALEVSVNGTPTLNITLQNSPDPQQVTLPNPITLQNGNSITFKITNIAIGINDTANETAISEIAFN